MTDLLHNLVQWDTDLLLAINGWHCAWADLFMSYFSAKLVWVPMYAALAYVLWRNLTWRQFLGCVVAVVLTIVLADQVCSHVIRPLVCRLRPANPESPIVDLVHIVGERRGGRYGFPSCHAANTFGLAFVVYFLLRSKLLSVFFIVWAVLTCYSRAYLGLHYPGDLLAGAVVGLGAAWLAYTLLVRVLRYRPPRPMVQAWVPIMVGGATVAVMLTMSFLP